jgi:hypothetical protein
MKSLLDELKIIPLIAWLIALLLAGGSLLLMFGRPLIYMYYSDFEMALMGGVILFLFTWVSIIGYIYADSQRRGMRHAMWTLLSIFIPYGIGIILYFVLRDPRLIPCPQCGVMGRPSYLFCTHCGADIAPSCPACKRAVEPDWNRCAHCGRDLSSQ